ncbi:MAG: HEAT repeat domain-containing protein [Nitrospirota bacterium]
MLILNMEQTDEFKEARDIVQNLIKARKTFRLYPHNNPVYAKTLDETFERVKHFLNYKDSFTLKVRQHSILYDSETVYHNPEKEDNLALFFFKDGIRELAFKSGLLIEELEEFLRIISLDFDREVVDDDVVTLLWEKDFKNISYVVDEAVLVDIDEEEYETVAERKVKEKVTHVDDLMKAYVDGFKEEDVKGISIVPLSDKDLQMLVEELEKESSDKIGKLVDILFELVHQAESQNDLEETFSFLRDTINFCLGCGDLRSTLDVMKRANELMNEPTTSDEEKKYLRLLFSYINAEEVIGQLAAILDSGIEIEGNVFEEFVQLFDKGAISPLIKYLGELKTIRARKSVIEALIIVGKKDIASIAKGLDDHRWYVVRNVIYILRKIADRRSIEHLLKTVRHGDIRVRKEVIKALGELGGQQVIQALKDSLEDPEVQVRITAAKALGTVGSDVAKKIILENVSDKKFKEKEFDEKRDFYEVISRWKDSEVFDFLVKTLKKKTLFGRSKNFENRACAAFGLGLLGNKDALPILERLRSSKNKLLKEYTSAAIRRLEYGQ